MQQYAQYVWVIWDLIAVIVFFVCADICARRGLISTLISFLGYFAAAAIAAALNSALARFLYKEIVRGAVLGAIIKNFMQTADAESMSDYTGSLPFLLKTMLLGQSDKLAEITPGAAETMAATIVDSLLEAPIMTILNAACFLLLFTVTAYLIRMLARFLTGMNGVPVLGTVNLVMGGVVGVLTGGLILYVTAFLLRMLITFSGESWWWLNNAVMESTYIWSVFY